LAVSDESFRALVSGQRRGPVATLLRGGLALASWPYGLAVGLRNRLFDWGWKRTHQAPVPVVSVGNLTVGGTGKTPCVEYVARFYRRHELLVAVLSRGYGGAGGVNDEALVLEENLDDVPHLQGADRVDLAFRAFEELESEVLVLDDAFQHRRLARDLDVVLVDATNPWGHGHLLPRGLLRESPRALRRADVIVLTRSDQVSATQREYVRQKVGRLAPGVPVAEAMHRPVELVNSDREIKDLEVLRGARVVAFAGLGNPAAFRRTVEDLGATIADFRTYPDHHPYSRSDIEELRRWARQQPSDGVVITTQKDLVKLRLPDLAGRPLWAVRVRLCGRDGGGLSELDRQLLSAVGRDDP